MKRGFYLGIDLGTSSVKLLLIDPEGNMIGESAASYPIYGEARGLFEQKPAEWIEAICLAADCLDETVAKEYCWRERLSGIGISAQMPTLVLIDERGAVLRDAIVWCDNRALEEANHLLEIWGAKRHYISSGVFLDGRYLLPMYLWIRNNEPELLREKHYVLSAGDYIYYWLCRQLAAPPSSASGYGVYCMENGNWDYDLVREAGVDPAILPPIKDSYDAGGRLCEESSRKLKLPSGVNVVCGGADSVCGVLGLGGDKDGTVCLICGSSTAILGVTDHLQMDGENTYFVTPMLNGKMVAMEADLLSTGTTQKWLLQRMNELRGEDCPKMTYSDLGHLVRKAPAGSDGLVFLPYLAGGEQGVLWDETLTGVWKGLTLNHGWPQMARSVYEGICFEIRRCLEEFRKGGLQIQKILVTGPVSTDDVFMQMIADVIGSSCCASNVANASARGAAMVAALGIQGFLPEQENEPREYCPDEENYKKYLNYYRAYLEASANPR